MAELVIDSSVLLAAVFMEPGYETVAEKEEFIIISSVNLAEAISVACRKGLPAGKARDFMLGIIDEVVNFDKEQAFIAGKLNNYAKKSGLSIGDCACIALGIIKKLPVYTADKTWKKLGLKADIRLIK